jgi:LemA protein
VEEAWSGIDVQLKRRHDLVPNLVETVRGYAAHERETLDRVTEARAEAVAATRSQVEPAEAHLGSALAEVRAVAEAYPELQAAESFRRLQAELAATEDEIQAARRIYNANVQDFNTRIQVFPNNLIAGRMSFTPRTFLEIDVVADRAVPQVAV